MPSMNKMCIVKANCTCLKFCGLPIHYFHHWVHKKSYVLSVFAMLACTLFKILHWPGNAWQEDISSNALSKLITVLSLYNTRALVASFCFSFCNTIRKGTFACLTLHFTNCSFFPRMRIGISFWRFLERKNESVWPKGSNPRRTSVWIMVIVNKSHEKVCV